MRKFEFTVYLGEIGEVSEAAANALYEAGCDDGSPASCDGSVWITFHREADSLDAAIRSAVSDIQRAGFSVDRLEIEHGALNELLEVP